MIALDLSAKIDVTAPSPQVAGSAGSPNGDSPAAGDSGFGDVLSNSLSGPASAGHDSRQSSPSANQTPKYETPTPADAGRSTSGTGSGRSSAAKGSKSAQQNQDAAGASPETPPAADASEAGSTTEPASAASKDATGPSPKTSESDAQDPQAGHDTPAAAVPGTPPAELVAALVANSQPAPPATEPNADTDALHSGTAPLVAGGNPSEAPAPPASLVAGLASQPAAPVAESLPQSPAAQPQADVTKAAPPVLPASATPAAESSHPSSPVQPGAVGVTNVIAATPAVNAAPVESVAPNRERQTAPAAQAADPRSPDSASSQTAKGIDAVQAMGNPESAPSSPNQLPFGPPSSTGSDQTGGTTLSAVRPVEAALSASPPITRHTADQRSTGESGDSSTFSADNLTGSPDVKQAPHGAPDAVHQKSDVAAVDRTQLLEHVSRGIQVSYQNGQEVRIRLSPPELGSLQIDVSVKDGTLSARLEVQNNRTQQILSDHLPQLKEALAQQGLAVDRIDVSVSVFDRPAGEGHADLSDRSFAQDRQPQQDPSQDPDQHYAAPESESAAPPAASVVSRTRRRLDQLDITV